MTSTTGLYRELYRHWERLAENRLQTLRGERGKREHLGTRLAIMITSWHDPYQLKRPLPWNYPQSLRVSDHVAPQPRPRAFPLKNGWSPLCGLFSLYWRVIFQQRKRENGGSFYTFTGKIERLETVRLRFFDISREPRTSRSHVTRAFPSGLRFKVHVCTPRPRSIGKWFTARFFAP